MFKVNYESLRLQKNPKCLFESFETRRKNNTYQITANLSVHDVYHTKFSKTNWFGKSENNRYLFIKVRPITNEVFFNEITKDNYLSLLETKRDFRSSKNLNINDFEGDSIDLKNHTPVFSNLDGVFYDFSYKTNMEFFENSNFLGFISYIYFDYQQFCLDEGKDILTLESSNANFDIDKFVLYKNGKINNKIERVTTLNNEIWLSDYTESANKIYFKTNNRNFELKKVVDTIKVIDADVLEKSAPSALNIQRFQNIRRKIDVMSYIGDINTTINQNGSLNIYLPIDILNFCSKNSNIYPMLNLNNLDNGALSWIILGTKLRDSYVERRNLYNQDVLRLDTGFVPNLALNREKKNFSNIGFLNILDSDIKYQQPSKYSYKLFFQIEDGYKDYLQNLVNTSKVFLNSFNNYYAYASKSANKRNSANKYENYNFVKNSFTDNFVSLMKEENSFWKNTLLVPRAYMKLFSLIEPGEITFTEEDLILAIAPTNTSLDNLGKFEKNFNNLIQKAEKIIESQQSNIISGEINLLDEFYSYNGTVYYDYFENTSNLSIEDIKRNNPVGSYLQPKKVVKVESSIFSDKFTYANILERTLAEFKISEQAEKLLVDNIRSKIEYQHLSGVVIPYLLLSEYFDKIYDFQKKEFIIKNIEQYTEYIFSLPLATLKAIYETLEFMNIGSASAMSKVEYTKKIIEYMKQKMPFFIDFFNNYASDEIYKDYKKSLLYSLIYGKITKIEYLDGFYFDETTQCYRLKNPIWKLLDLNDSKINDKISSGINMYIRLTQINLDPLLFFTDSKTDLEIFNKFAIVG